MEEYTLQNDMKIFLVQADSFPAGIEPAFQKLEKMIGGPNGRTFFGISHGSLRGIIYKAGVLEKFDGEGEKLGCETFILKKGDYMTETIMDWHKNIPLIGTTFSQLVKLPEFDTTMPCVEWYKSDRELMCMVKIKEKVRA